MPKLKVLRLVNIEYGQPKDSMIDDLCLEPEGKDLLVKLVNGGGKSIIIQMIHNLFLTRADQRAFTLNGKRRDFCDFFSPGYPGFIVAEWQLDGSDRLLQTGIMARLREGEKTPSNMAIKSWINEYDAEDTYSIKKLPLVYTKEDGRYLCSWKQGNEWMSQADAHSKGYFSSYNLMDKTGRTSYQERLVSYGFSILEMLQSREFNHGESGITKFMENNPRQKNIISSYILPAIISKLDYQSGGSQVETLAKEMVDFLTGWLSNKKKLDNRSITQSCKNQLEKSRNEAEKIHELYVKRDELLDQYDGYIWSMFVEKERIEELLNQLKSKLDLSKNIILEATHEKLTIEFEQCKEDYERQLKNKNKLHERIEAVKAKLDQAERIKTLLNLKFNYDQQQDQIRNIEKLKAKINYAQISKNEQQLLLDTIGSWLFEEYKTQIEEKNTELENLNDCREGIGKEISNLVEEIRNLENDKSRTSRQIDNNKEDVRDFCNLINSLYDSNRSRFQYESFKPIVIKTVIANEIACQNDYLKKLINRDNELKQKYSSLIKTKSELQSREQQISNELEALPDKQKEIQNQLSKLMNDKTERQNLVKRLSLPFGHLWNTSFLCSSIEKRINQLNRRIDHQLKTIPQLEQTMRNLKSGVNSGLSEEMKTKIEEMGYEALTGIEWLRQNRALNHAEKQAILKTHPLFAFSVIVDKDYRNKILTEFEKSNLQSSSLIRFDSPENLTKAPLLSDAFYTRLDEEILDAERTHNKMVSLENKVQQAEEDINRFKKEIEEYYRLQGSLQSQDWNADSEEQLINKLHSFEQKKEDLQFERIETQQALKKNDFLIDDLENLQNKTTNNLSLTRSLLTDWKQVSDRFPKIEEKYCAIGELEAYTEELTEQISEANADLEEHYYLQSVTNNQIISQRSQINSLENEQRQWNESKMPENPPDFEHNFEKAKIQATSLKNQLRETPLSQLQEELDTLNSQLKLSNDFISTELTNSHLTKDELLKIHYDYQSYDKAGKTCNQLAKEIKDLNSEHEDLISQCSNLNRRWEEKLETIQKEIGRTVLFSPVTHDLSGIKELLKRYKEENCLLVVQQTDNLERLNKLKSYLQAHSLEKDALTPKITFQLCNEDIGEITNTCNKLRSESSRIEKDIRRKTETVINNLQKYSVSLPVDQTALKDIVNVQIEQHLPGLRNKEHLEAIRQSVDYLERHLQTLDKSLETIRDLEKKLNDNLCRFARNIHSEFDNVDAPMSLRISGSNRRLLDIDLPLWNEELAKLKISQIIEDGKIEIQKNNPSRTIKEYCELKLSAKYFYPAIIDTDTIEISICKIRSFGAKSSLLPWDSVHTSGGEGFLCAVIFVLMIMQYQRSDLTSYAGKKLPGSFLIMDNPFAMTQDFSMLDVFSDICKKFNTQIIAFSDVENEKIFDIFPVIDYLTLLKDDVGKMHMRLQNIRENWASLDGFEVKEIKLK